eukprot:TRINITY_DN6673_c0_g1_i1.p1 TRINITY_DN6673_c0_g1~~TRINITY_DN6673_c0_g1_i1.p1  ORF type:complete len:1202 (+),score=382.05 TRINITY_DN6673_c0_g1_i1:138-3743(+)
MDDSAWRDKLPEFRSSLSASSKVILPNDSGFADAVARWADNAVKQAALVVQPADAVDVGRAVRFAVDNKLEIAVKSGGHSSGGYSSVEGGLVIDLAQLKSVRVQDKTLVIGGGAQWQDVDKEAAASGLATVGPVFNELGVANYVLAGGWGYLSGICGLAIDNLVRFEVVNAEGNLVHADRDNNPDLFWALRGGGGNFGIVTSVVLKAHRVANVWTGSLVFPTSQTEEVARAVASFRATAPPEASALLTISRLPSNEIAFTVHPVYVGREEHAIDAFAPFLDLKPTLRLTSERPYAEANTLESAFFSAPGRRHIAGHYIRDVTPEALREMVTHFEEGPSGSSAAFVELYNDIKACKPEPIRTAFPHRVRGNTGVFVVAHWKEERDDQKMKDWAAAVLGATDQVSVGRGYANFVESDQAGAMARQLYGENVERLQKLKHKFDPQNVFKRNRNIVPIAGKSKLPWKDSFAQTRLTLQRQDSLSLGALIHESQTGPAAAEFLHDQIAWKKNFDDFKRTLSQATDVIQAGEDGYEAAIVRWAENAQKAATIVARPAETADVVKLVRFAREHRMETAVRSGGFSAAGFSSVDGGLVIDMSKLNSVEVKKDSFVIGGGAKWRDVDLAGAGQGLATVGSPYSEHSVSSTVLGGGWGYLSGLHGLSADNVSRFEVVLADGSLQVCDKKTNTELYWGLRGGGGNFGIVVSLTLEAHKVSPVWGGTLVFPASQAEDVARAIAQFRKDPPPEASALLVLAKHPFPKPEGGEAKASLILHPVFVGPEKKAREAFAPFLDLKPVVDQCTVQSYPNVNTLCNQYHAVKGRRHIAGHYIKDITPDMLRNMVKYLEAGPSATSTVFIELYNDKKIAKVKPTDTAFAHRVRGLSAVVVNAHWEDPKDDKLLSEWGAGLLGITDATAVGRSPSNFVETERASEMARQIYAENVERLQLLKTKVDPTNFFRRNRNIIPAGKANKVLKDTYSQTKLVQHIDALQTTTEHSSGRSEAVELLLRDQLQAANQKVVVAQAQVAKLEERCNGLEEMLDHSEELGDQLATRASAAEARVAELEAKVKDLEEQLEKYKPKPAATPAPAAAAAPATGAARPGGWQGRQTQPAASPARTGPGLAASSPARTGGGVAAAASMFGAKSVGSTPPRPAGVVTGAARPVGSPMQRGGSGGSGGAAPAPAAADGEKPNPFGAVLRKTGVNMNQNK